MHLFLVPALASQFGWSVPQFDVAKAYMLAAPLHTYFIRHPPGFAEFLRLKFGRTLFDPDHFLLRVTKNAYCARDAGRAWYDALLTFRTIDRCAFVLCEIIDGVCLTCIILVYVYDLVVVRPSVLTARIIEMIKDRFPLTEGGGDYMSRDRDRHFAGRHSRTPRELRQESRKGGSQSNSSTGCTCWGNHSRICAPYRRMLSC